MIDAATLMHDRLANTALFYTFAMGAWALWLAIRNRGLDGGYLGALVIGESVLVVQALLGALLWARAGFDGVFWLHVLYGILVVLLWPFVYTFSRGAGAGRQEALMFFATSFFLFLMLLRSVETASGI